MKMKKILFIYIAVLMLISCSSNKTPSPSLPISPLYDEKLNQYELAMAKKAFPIFCQTCQPLMSDYASDIEKIEITNGFDRTNDSFDNGCWDYRCRDYNWDKQIYIKIKIKDRPKLIPLEMRAFGHTMHFYLGGPKNPGITTNKFPQLCGVQAHDDGSDVYIPVPSLSFIKKP